MPSLQLKTTTAKNLNQGTLNRSSAAVYLNSEYIYTPLLVIKIEPWTSDSKKSQGHEV